MTVMTTFSLETWLEQRRAAVDDALAQALALPSADDPERLREAMRYAVLQGGKRMRPMLVVAACEAAIALALILMLCRRSEKLDVAIWHQMREENLPAYADPDEPHEPRHQPQWPTLSPAGIEPDAQSSEPEFRSHV